MIRQIAIPIFIISAILFMNSCKYDKVKVEPIIDNGGLVDTIDCSTTPASFSKDVLPLLQDKCNSCHTDGGNNGGINVDNYDNVSANANKILSAIKHESETLNMPKDSPKLSDENINIVQCWIQNGKQDD